MEGDDRIAVEGIFKGLLEALRRVLNLSEEPMINIAGFHEGDKWRLVIFPRRKHRPDAFFREGDARIVVSPGLIDMGGVLVTPVEKDFKRLNAAAVERIYREVSLEAKILKEAIERLGEESLRPRRKGRLVKESIEYSKHRREKGHDKLGGIGEGVEGAALHQDGNHRVQAVCEPR
jgi:hypothetical protein